MIGPYELNQIYTGDARELSKSIPDASIDLIFTDPPYPKEYLPLYDWLGQEAARVLKPDGFLIAYAGTYWKPEVINRLGASMDYFFDFILVGSGNGPMLWQRRIISGHKSILCYCKRGSTALPRCNVLSRFVGTGQDKRYHAWGQDEGSARYYIDCVSKVGDVVLDPFVGGGTTLAMCKVLDQPYIGFEIDPAVADIARARVTQQQMPLIDVNYIQLESEEAK